MPAQGKNGRQGVTYVVALASFDFLLWVVPFCLIDVGRPRCRFALWFCLLRLLPDTLLFAGTLTAALDILSSTHPTDEAAKLATVRKKCEVRLGVATEVNCRPSCSTETRGV